MEDLERRVDYLIKMDTTLSYNEIKSAFRSISNADMIRKLAVYVKVRERIEEHNSVEKERLAQITFEKVDSLRSIYYYVSEEDLPGVIYSLWCHEGRIKR